MPVIAVTGGIGAGKSVVAGVLAEGGAVVIDADDLARQAVQPGSAALEQIAERFGRTVIAPDGSLNRALLGSIVFGDPEALGDLNAIVHPEVRRLYDTRVAEISRIDPGAIVVYDVPLLAEARSSEEFALVVVVNAPAHARIERLVRHRGLTLEQARARVEAQATDDERLALADVVIDSSGELDETLRQAKLLLAELRARWPDRLQGIPREFPIDAS